MNAAQRLHIRTFSGVLAGMFDEIESKRLMLLERLKHSPGKVVEVQRDLGSLEGQMDSLLVALDFVETWPQDDCECHEHEHQLEPAASRFQTGHSTRLSYT